MVSVELGVEHGYVAAVAVAYTLVLVWGGMLVGKARKAYGVKYPTMYLPEVRAREVFWGMGEAGRCAPRRSLS